MKRNIPGYGRFLAAALIYTCLALSLAGCGGSTPAPANQELKKVKVVQAAISSIITDIEYSGKLKPVREVSVSPKISGKVASVKADAGNRVERGEILFTLDSNDFQAQLQQQQANLESSRTNAEQALRNAQIAYDNAKESYDKNKQLFDAGAISMQTLDDSKMKLDNAAIALSFSKNKYDLESGGSGISPAEAGVQAASTQIQNTVVVSPITGVISICNIDEGEIAASSSPAVTIIDTGEMVAEINVPDTMIGKVKKGQVVPVKVTALDNKTIGGVVNSVSPAADSKTQMYTIKININNRDNGLKPGMFARVSLQAEKKDNAITVPNEVLKVEDGVSYVYAVVQSTVKKIPVDTGLSNDRITEIVGGLDKDADIISEGQIFLNDGEKVNIIK